jgi:hypothetical protein
MSALRVGILCFAFAGCWNPDELTRKPPATCPDANAPFVNVSIASGPIADPVVSDLDVIGTLSGDSASFVTEIRVGVIVGATQILPPQKPVTTKGSEIWNVTMPIEVLLGPNNGPGTVRLDVTALGDDGCSLLGHTQSNPFNVGFPPPPADGPYDSMP